MSCTDQQNTSICLTFNVAVMLSARGVKLTEKLHAMMHDVLFQGRAST